MNYSQRRLSTLSLQRVQEIHPVTVQDEGGDQIEGVQICQATEAVVWGRVGLWDYDQVEDFEIHTQSQVRARAHASGNKEPQEKLTDAKLEKEPFGSKSHNAYSIFDSM